MKKLLIGIFALLLITSCNDDDNNSSVGSRIDIATVENPNLSTAFYFSLDNGYRLFASKSDFLNYRPKDGQRIIASYTILATMSASSSYNQEVRLNDVYEILTKGIFKIKPQQQDSIGNDQIEIKSMWIGSDYLNVEFEYLGLNKTHYISLVSDSTKTFSDNKIHLEFRHNAHGDYPTYSKWGMASFNLRSIRLSNSSVDSIKIAIHTREYATPADKIYPLTYKFTLLPPKSAIKKVTFPIHSVENIH